MGHQKQPSRGFFDQSATFFEAVSGRNHKETCAGRIVSLTSPTRSSLRVSRSVSSPRAWQRRLRCFPRVACPAEVAPIYKGLDLTVRRRRQRWTKEPWSGRWTSIRRGGDSFQAGSRVLKCAAVLGWRPEEGLLWSTIVRSWNTQPGTLQGAATEHAFRSLRWSRFACSASAATHQRASSSPRIVRT